MIVVTLISIVIALASMPRVMVLRFLADANGRNYDRAYVNTSSSFQGYIPREHFEQWLQNGRSWTVDDYDYGHFSLDEHWTLELNLDSQKGSDRLVFVWEQFGWKLKHQTIHWK